MTSVGLTPSRFNPATAPRQPLAFPEAEYTARLDKLCAELRSYGIDLLWMTTPEAIAWLHGLSLSWYKANSPMRYPQCYGTAVDARSGRFIHFDNPSEQWILHEMSVSRDNRWLPDRDAVPNLEFICRELRREGWLTGRIALELWSYIPNPAISSMFTGAFRQYGCDIVDGSAVVRRVRRVKSQGEIECMERAMRICDVGHAAVRELLRPGMTELSLLGAVSAAMADEGGEFPALLPILYASPMDGGNHTGSGHRTASRRRINSGEALFADLCGVFNRYHSNVMRAYYVGGDPPAAAVDRYQKAGSVFSYIEKECKAGQTVGAFNAQIRRYLEDVGLWSSSVGWGVGYELGLCLPPDWVGEFYFHLGDSRGLERVFEPGMVTNFEVCFDTAMVDTIVWDSHLARVLSRTPRELIVVG